MRLLVLSCTTDIEMPPPPNEPGSSSSAARSSSSVVSSSSVLSSSSLSYSATSSSSSVVSSSSGGSVVGRPSSSSIMPSSSSVALPSSSSLKDNDIVHCLLNSGACEEYVYSTCKLLAGTIVNSCPNIPPSSSSAGSGLCAGFVDGTTRLHYEKNKAQFCDARDGKKYVYVKIGTQVWMAENLNYNAAGSLCYGNLASNCTTYGRLYNWATTLALSSSCNSSYCISQISLKHRGICPIGWHIPTYDEWIALETVVGGSSVAAKHLKAASGWSNCASFYSDDYDCEDTYGFSALPGGGGYLNEDGDFYYAGYHGDWWIAGENSSSNAYTRYMYNDQENVNSYDNDKSYLFSVRCVQD